MIVNDSRLNSDPATSLVTVSAKPVVNHAPKIGSTPVTTATVGILYSYNVSATDSDNDTLSYNLSAYPTGMTINSQTGQINWTPAANQTGSQAVSVNVSDGKGGSDSQSFSITVNAADQVNVPALIDQSRASAEAAIQQAKLNIGTLTFQHNAKADGSVISQSPAAGSSVKIGTPINLSVSIGPDNGLPPNPATIAPALDQTVATTTYAASQFLYTGNNPIQTLSNGQPLAAGTIEAKRAAVIRGKVLDKQNNPLSGVTVSIKDHPELGQTLSRVDGQYDLAVNGGGVMTINLKKDGYLPVQRSLTNVSWQDYAIADDAVLIQQDSKVTTIDLNNTTEAFQVAQGNVVTDADGSRQASLLIPQGTQAQVYNPDGSSRQVSSLNLRLTEYTVGANGLEAMPGQLPPSSAYTYAFEMKADEADVKLSGKDVLFDRPVPFYITNFLGFPVGTAVPVGYYDRDQAIWVPSENGKVIKVLAISSGIATLDTDGDGAADDTTKLAALGVTDQERTKLAGLYTAGQTLWRVQVTHLSTWDCNWPFIMPNDAVAPTQKFPVNRDNGKFCATCAQRGAPTELSGSIIEAENQILRESLPIIGTGLTLNYASDRVPGRTLPQKLDIPVSGATLPPSVKRIDLVIDVAGKRIEKRLPVVTNHVEPFEWDGLDAFGRPVEGAQQATVKIGYVYDPVYATAAEQAAAFGRFSGVPLEGSRARKEVRIWQEHKTVLGGPNGRQDAAGWSLSAHHRYDPVEHTLYQGDGRRRSANALSASGVITKFAQLPAFIAGSAVAPDGTLFVASGDQVVKVSSDGTIVTVVAGTGVPGFSGDGGLAQNAQLNNPQGLALANDGSLYIADTANARIRKITPNGTINTIAGRGNGVIGLFHGCYDGQLATTGYFVASAVAVGLDNSIYFTGGNIGHSTVCRISPDGVLSTVAGNGGSGFGGDGGPAFNAKLFSPDGLAFGPDGSLFVMDSGNNRVRKISTDGIITTAAGNGNNRYSGDGGPAVNAGIRLGGGLAVSPSGEVYITEAGFGANTSRVRKVRTDGLISTFAGGGTTLVPNAIDGALSASVKFNFAGSAGVQEALSPMPDGSLMVRYNNVLYRVTSAFSGFSGGELAIPSDDGSALYRFDKSGRHLTTVDTTTGKTLLSFVYDAKGQLSTVTDLNGLVTSIERDGLGNATAIVAPFGQRTALQSNPNGYLAKVSNPAGEAHQMTYGAGGLLAAFKDPRGNASSFIYDAEGRLLSDSNAAAGKLSLARTELADGSQIAATTAEGLTSTYTVHDAVTGERVRESRSPDGTSVQSSFANDGIQTTTMPDGTIVTQEQSPDARIGFGMLSPVTSSSTVSTGGLTATASAARSLVLASATDPLTLTKLTETSTLNGRTSTSVYDAATKTITATSPANRKATALTDAQGRIIQSQVTGILASNASYDAQGRLASVSQGTGVDQRTLSYSYNPQGYLASVLDPIGRQVQFAYDQAGRVTTQTLPDGRQILYSYDANGNLTSLTPPGQPAHVFNYTAVDQTADYQPPLVNAGGNNTVYSYDKDKALTSVTRPDGLSVELNRDSAGRVSSLALQPANQTLASYAYDNVTGKLTTISAADANLGFSYNGALLTQTAWSGAVTGSVGYAYDNSFRVTSVSLNGANPIAYVYDNDDLLTKAGNLTLSRNVQNGLLTGTALGSLTEAYSYSGFGELSAYEAKYGTFSHLKLAYTRDKLGRITQKQETKGGVLNTYNYGYDTAGRLVEVKKNNVVQASYSYDDNGNRLSRTAGSVTQTGTYDAQDRLLTYNGASYSYTDNGELKTKTVGAAVTQYDYDVLGNLKKVVLPGGGQIDYLTDGQNRRIGKKVNGSLTQAFLWQGQLQPIAELDGSGNVVSRFVYATGVNVPDYMIKGGVTYRLIKDNLGSPRVVVNIASNTVAQEMEFDEFGRVTKDTNPGFQPFGFAGGLYDKDTGLVRFGARDYDAVIGRWVSKDPIGFGGGAADLYQYTDNDPVNYIDFSGAFKFIAKVDGSNYWVDISNVNIEVTDLRANGGRKARVSFDASVSKITKGCWKEPKKLKGLSNEFVELPPVNGFDLKLLANVLKISDLEHKSIGELIDDTWLDLDILSVNVNEIPKNEFITPIKYENGFQGEGQNICGCFGVQVLPPSPLFRKNW
nr:RHS repeat-associated core domain-containing protein [Methylomonas koyamae]